MNNQIPSGEAPAPQPDPHDPNNPILRLVQRIDKDPRVKEALMVAIRKAQERARGER
jgi:hypothetical protein